MRRRLDDEGGLAGLRLDVDGKALGVERVVREAGLERELAGDQIDVHLLRIDLARSRLVQRADGDLAVVGLGVEKAVGELDLVDRRVVAAHRQVEVGKEALVVVVDAKGADQVDVEIERIDLPQLVGPEPHELQRRQLRGAEPVGTHDDERGAVGGARARPERPVLEAAAEGAAPGGIGGLELGQQVGAQRGRVGSAGRRS